MDLGAMAVVAAAITLERLVPAGRRTERALGAVIVAIGVVMLV
jgi:predicted metal-binding membrane protein